MISKFSFNFIYIERVKKVRNQNKLANNHLYPKRNSLKIIRKLQTFSKNLMKFSKILLI